MTDDSSRLEHFPHHRPIPTRWHDNDAYGHVNNVVYYAFFDTAVNAFLIEAGALDIGASPVIAVVAETRCVFRRSLHFPETVTAGMRVARLGRSSVRYEIGLFGETDRGAGDAGPAAFGHFVHVYVDRATRRPAELPDAVRAALVPLLVETTAAAVTAGGGA